MDSPITLYDTLTRELVPVEMDEPFNMYVCGPTVYAPIHIGNARPFATYRLLARYAAFRGLKVTHVSNITDINEKIDRAAKDAGVDSFMHAQSMQAAYTKATNALGLGRPDIEPRATEYVDEMISLIEDLIKNDLAYVTDTGNVYCHSDNYTDNGALSGRKNNDDAETVRELVGTDKRHPADFALWKTGTEQPLWKSPWGLGRPGWHLECSAMSRHTVGHEFTLHGGGRDLLFPHHEAERAQSRGAGDAHAHLWWHTGMINVGGIKGSKTDGNLPTLQTVLDTHDPRALLLAFWSAHPRSDLEWSDTTLSQAQSRLERWQNIWQRRNRSALVHDMKKTIKLHTWQKIMDEDLDTPRALAFIEKLFDSGEASDFAALELILPLMGLTLQEITVIPDSIEDLARERVIARNEKDWARSDSLREQIKTFGYLVEDTPGGYRLLPVN